jgi:hypothetical protein
MSYSPLAGVEVHHFLAEVPSITKVYFFKCVKQGVNYGTVNH